MAVSVVAHFEHETVRLVYAEVSGNTVTLKKTLVVPLPDFDHYLSKEPVQSFLVTADFNDAYQFSMLVPPLKEKIAKKIMEAEIRKRFPDLKRFAYFSISTGEVAHEGRKMDERFICAIEESELSPITSLFVRHDKTIVSLLPGYLPISRLAADADDDQPTLLIAATPQAKTILLVKNNALLFVRQLESAESGYTAFDIQNINMTVNYCRQSLRLNPAKAVFIGTAPDRELLADLIVRPEIPQDVFDRFSGMDTAFLVPVAALLHGAALKQMSVLPEAYCTYLRDRKLLVACTVFFCVVACLAIALTAYRTAEIFSVRARIDSLKAELTRVQPKADEYERQRAAYQPQSRLTAFLRSAESAPDFSRPFVRLAVIGGTGMQDVNLEALKVNADGAFLLVTLRGTFAGEKFSAMQDTFVSLKQIAKESPGAEIVAEKMELKGRAFEVTLRSPVQESVK